VKLKRVVDDTDTIAASYVTTAAFRGKGGRGREGGREVAERIFDSSMCTTTTYSTAKHVYVFLLAWRSEVVFINGNVGEVHLPQPMGKQEIQSGRSTYTSTKDIYQPEEDVVSKAILIGEEHVPVPEW
jgi:hypothetical protein